MESHKALFNLASIVSHRVSTILSPAPTARFQRGAPFAQAFYIIPQGPCAYAYRQRSVTAHFIALIAWTSSQRSMEAHGTEAEQPALARRS